MRHYLPSNLKRLRAIRGYSAEIVSLALGVPRSTLSSWENGVSEPNLDRLLMLGEYYRLSIDVLLRSDLSDRPKSHIEVLQRAY